MRQIGINHELRALYQIRGDSSWTSFSGEEFACSPDEFRDLMIVHPSEHAAMLAAANRTGVSVEALPLDSKPDRQQAITSYIKYADEKNEWWDQQLALAPDPYTSPSAAWQLPRYVPDQFRMDAEKAIATGQSIVRITIQASRERRHYVPPMFEIDGFNSCLPD